MRRGLWTCLIAALLLTGCEETEADKAANGSSTSRRSSASSGSGSGSGAHREKFGDKIGAIVSAKMAVNERLRSPGTADYGWQTADECVTDKGNGRYFVQGWVDAQNGFGAKMRADWSVAVQYEGGDGPYRVVFGPLIFER